MSGSMATSNSIQVKFSHLDLNNPFSLMFTARKGISPKLFYDFAAYIQMPEKHLAALLHLSSRTISNYKAQHKRIGPIPSEHLMKLVALFGKGEEIFGNLPEFNYWLQKPFWNATEKPMDWLYTPGGVDLVSEELDRLEHAYVV
ncbi:MAG: antitoxin Xre-like helix-turn-helix domain-containing protein [Chitinophagaceae bacterium]